MCRFSHRLGGMDPLSLTTITKPRTTKPEESAFRLSDGTKTCLIVIVAYYCALDMQFSRDYTKLKSLSEGLLVTHLRVWQVFGGFSFPFHSPARTDRDRVSLTRSRRRRGRWDWDVGGRNVFAPQVPLHLQFQFVLEGPSIYNV